MKPIRFLPLFLLAGAAYAQDPIVSPQVRTSLDNGCICGNETSAACTADGREIIGGFNDYRPGNIVRSGFGVSNDGGASWQHVIVRPPAAFQTSVEGDPMAAYDRRTNTVWAGAMAFGGNGGIYVARKNPGQNTFQASVMARIGGGVDKGWMEAGPQPGQPNTTRLYIAYNEGIIWSDDMGNSFTAPRSLGSGLGFLPRVGPAGQVYITYWNVSAGVMFRRSFDGGLTFQAPQQVATRMDVWSTGFFNPRIPGSYRIPPIQGMAVNPVNGAIVIAYFDTTNMIGSNRNIDIYIVRSTDQGASWTTPQRLPFRPMTTVGDMLMPWIEYSEDGRLHLTAFNTGYNFQNDGTTTGLLDQDYAYSDDDGANWTRFRLTPSSYESFNDGRNAGSSFMGDYLGIAVSRRFAYPFYPDCRTNQAEIYTNTVFNPIVRPTAVSFFRGSQTGGSLQSLFRQDGDLLTAQNGLALSQQEAPLQMDLMATSPALSPSSAKLHLWTSANTVGVEQRVLLFNYQTQQWDTLDTRPATLAETNTVVDIPNPADYINDADGAMQARLAYIPVGPVIASQWTVRTNQAVFLIGQ